jgi:multidrug transporter EmrE-like cation transporter
VSITFVFVTLGAVWFFDETVTAKTIAGIVLILAGFVVLAGSKGK